MGRRREEKVDEEELARLMGNVEGESSKIRVKMPNTKVNEMFAIAEQILGGRRVTVLCADGETRMARIPGKMRRRQWVREGDLIIVWPWDFQDSKADVKHRYTKTQAMYLSRKGLLNEVVDDFGMDVRVNEEGDDDLFASSLPIEENADSFDEQSEEADDLFADDGDDDDLFADDSDDDDLFADDGDDDMFAEEELEEPPKAEEEVFEVKDEYPEDESADVDDDDDDDVDDLFA